MFIGYEKKKKNRILFSRFYISQSVRGFYQKNIRLSLRGIYLLSLNGYLPASDINGLEKHQLYCLFLEK